MNQAVNQCNVVQSGIAGGGMAGVEGPHCKVDIKAHKTSMRKAGEVMEKG